ncbi:hypothetical protein [Paenibacillus piscarius]|uniref:hypothetical protein n=1 Tax=Paenibacillus piscarius TaxID=1089681 RepID=UPI001EE8556F|nr:hypothetical protein [Paenibacillus piscarius]
MKKKGTAVLLIVVMMIVIGIWILPIHLKSGEYVHVTNEEIVEIIEKEKIEILGIKNLTADGASITILPYKSEDEVGVIEASNKDGELDYRKSQFVRMMPDRIFTMGSNAGLYYSVVFINDKKIINEMYKLKIHFHEGNFKEVNKENSSTSAFIITKEKGKRKAKDNNPRKIEVFNESGKIIYDSEKDNESNRT